MKDKPKTDRARIIQGWISGFGLMVSRQRLRPACWNQRPSPCSTFRHGLQFAPDDSRCFGYIRASWKKKACVVAQRSPIMLIVIANR
jgi:hypothetical protein